MVVLYPSMPLCAFMECHSKRGQEWIHYNYGYKTYLLNIPKISMDLTVDTWIHGIKITAVKDLVKS